MPKHPVSLWLIDERKRHGWKAEEVARRLRDAGVDAADGTYRVWESGRKPSDTAIRAMETLFDSTAPAEAAPTPDLAALVAALTEQTRVNTMLVERLIRYEDRVAKLEELTAQLAEAAAAAHRANAARGGAPAAPTPPDPSIPQPGGPGRPLGSPR